jgi:hypothetical protein
MDSRLSNLSVKPGQKNPIDSNTIRSSSLRDYTVRQLELQDDKALQEADRESDLVNHVRKLAGGPDDPLRWFWDGEVWPGPWNGKWDAKDGKDRVAAKVIGWPIPIPDDESVWFPRCFFFALMPLTGEPDPRTHLWQEYAECSNVILPTEEARLHYGRSFKCANNDTFDEDQCGENDDDFAYDIRRREQYGSTDIRRGHD